MKLTGIIICALVTALGALAFFVSPLIWLATVGFITFCAGIVGMLVVASVFR